MQAKTSFFVALFFILLMLTVAAPRVFAKADAGSAQTVNEGDTVVLDGSKSKLPGGIDTYQWQQTDGTPTVTLMDADTATASFTAPNIGVGGTTLTFQLTVNNSSGKSDTDTTAVTISFVNQAPIANAGNDQTVDEETTVTLDGSSSYDPDPGDSITYQWEQSGGSPNVQLTDTNKVQASFYAPNILGDTILTFQLTVTDSSGSSDTDTTAVNLRGDNDPPIAEAGPNQNVNEGIMVTLNGSNSYDPDLGDSIAYNWEQTGGSPTVTLTGANTAQASFTAPNVGLVGASLTFKLTVSDSGGLKDTDTAIVNVSFVNSPPVAVANPPTQTVEEGILVILNGSNSYDPDAGDSISYQWEQTSGSPIVTLTGANTAQASFTAPNVGSDGASLTFKLTVSDSGGLKDTDDVIVNVTGKNEPPIADAGPDQTVGEESLVTLDGSNSNDPEDPQARSLSYQWKQKAGMPSVTLSNPQFAQPTFTAPNVSVGGTSLTFELTVTDSGDLQSSDTTIVNVTGDNDPPTADAGANQTVDENTIVILHGSNSFDPDDGIKSYQWEQIGGPMVTLSEPTIEQPIFAAPEVSADGVSLTFELTVKDVGGLQSSDTTIVNVTGDNDPPKADAGADQGVLEKSTVTLDGSNSSDPDDGIDSYRWKQVAGRSVIFSDPTSTQPTFEAPSFDDSGDQPLIFELVVTHSGGLQSSDSTNVSVSNYEKDNPGASGGGCFINSAGYGFLMAQ
jgi:hypothetical protein